MHDERLSALVFMLFASLHLMLLPHHHKFAHQVQALLFKFGAAAVYFYLLPLAFNYQHRGFMMLRALKRFNHYADVLRDIH